MTTSSTTAHPVETTSHLRTLKMVTVALILVAVFAVSFAIGRFTAGQSQPALVVSHPQTTVGAVAPASCQPGHLQGPC